MILLLLCEALFYAAVMPIKIFAIVSHDSVIAVQSFVLCGCNAYQNICHLSKS